MNISNTQSVKLVRKVILSEVQMKTHEHNQNCVKNRYIGQ